MPVYRVTYRPDVPQPPELVEADRVELEADVWLVSRRTVFLIGRAREVVIRRLPAGPGAEVVEVVGRT